MRQLHATGMQKAAGFINRGCIKRILLYYIFVKINSNTPLLSGNQVRDVRAPWKKRKPPLYEEIPLTERTSLLSPSSSDGELANVLGYASGPYGSNRTAKDRSSSIETDLS